MGNAYSGLGGTQAVSLPMLTALRKFSILFTIIAEVVILKYAVSNFERIVYECSAEPNDLYLVF